MTTILQISDTHIVPDGAKAYGVVDTAAALEKAVASIVRMLPQWGGIDAIVVTGDLTDHGTLQEYARFQAIAAALPEPLLCVPGNHDRREPMRTAFANEPWMPTEGPIQWVHDLGSVAIVGVDTLVEGQGDGAVCEAGLAFLKETLDQLAPNPVLLALHHPPISTGIPTMDAQGLGNAGALADLLGSYPGPLQFMAGHIHRMITGAFAGHPVMVAPGTSHAVTLECRPEQPNSLTFEPPGALLHQWTGQGFRTHMLHLGAFDGPHPFAGL